MSDTATVLIEVLDVTMLPGRGRVMGVAQVELIIDGVSIILQGVRVLRRGDIWAIVEPSCYRHTDGTMVPAMALPEELENAIARAVLERVKAMRQAGAPSEPRLLLPISDRIPGPGVRLGCLGLDSGREQGNSLFKESEQLNRAVPLLGKQLNDGHPEAAQNHASKAPGGEVELQRRRQPPPPMPPPAFPMALANQKKAASPFRTPQIISTAFIGVLPPLSLSVTGTALKRNGASARRRERRALDRRMLDGMAVTTRLVEAALGRAA